MDLKQKAKEHVLQQLIEAMDSRMVDDLKGKSPKFMKVETNDPKMAQQVVKNAIEDKMEDDQEDPSKELSLDDIKEDQSEGEDPLKELNQKPKADMNDEDLQRLLEMYQKLK